MRILTRLPRDLQVQLHELDPAADTDVDVPAIPDVYAWAAPDDANADHHVPEPVAAPATEAQPRRRPRRRAIAVAAVLAVAAVVAGVVVVDWHGDLSAHHPAGGSTFTSPRGDSAAAKIWGPFPVDRAPRPIVLMQSDVIDPASGFPNDTTKQAYLAHRVRPGTSLPTSPTRAGGYELRTAAAAVAELGGGAELTATNSVTVASVTLTEHGFSTDRGYVTLPAWAVELVGVADPTYVLAVGTQDRFDYPLDASASVGSDAVYGAGIIAARGSQLTFAFTPTHASTDPCDASVTESVDLAVGPTVVVLTITRITTPPMFGGPLSCQMSAGLGIDRLTPGAPDTKTVTLDQDLGNRPVVNDHGTPWVVTALN